MFEVQNWAHTQCGNSDTRDSEAILMTSTYYVRFYFQSEGKYTLVASSNHPHYIPSGWDVQNIMDIITNANLLEYKLWRLSVEGVRSTSLWGFHSSHSLNPCAFCVKIRVAKLYNEPACWIRQNQHIFSKISRNCSNSFVKCDQNVLGAKLDTHSVRKLGRMRFWSGFDDCDILCALFFQVWGKMYIGSQF